MPGNKLLTKVPEQQETSLYEALVAERMDGCDICDVDWDWGIYLGIPDGAKSIDSCEDGYDKFCFILCLNLKTKGIQPEWYTPCNVCGFIEEHRATFEEFFNEKNREGYRPSDYEGPLKPDEDKGYYEAFMEPMESLIAGNYSESDYDELVTMLLGEGE